MKATTKTLRHQGRWKQIHAKTMVSVAVKMVFVVEKIGFVL